jgi:hypothetical protein
MTDQIRPTTSLLDTYPFGQIRRNHGLEHATLHILAQHHPETSIAGHSGPSGFWIIGKVSTEAVREAVAEALQRLRQGERRLAVHANCGTNLVTSGVMAGLAGALAIFGADKGNRDKLERLPLAISLATVALMVAQPVGLLLQARVTTSGEPGTLEVVEIRSSQRGNLQAHRVITR